VLLFNFSDVDFTGTTRHLVVFFDKLANTNLPIKQSRKETELPSLFWKEYYCSLPFALRDLLLTCSCQIYTPDVLVVEQLEESIRGAGGFGSTGK
jgi:hypothetical protein